MKKFKDYIEQTYVGLTEIEKYLMKRSWDDAIKYSNEKPYVVSREAMVRHLRTMSLLNEAAANAIASQEPISTG